MNIVDLRSGGDSALRQAAELLLEPEPFDWPTLDAALAEVRVCLEPGKIARMAVDGDTVLGWIGGQERDAGNVWELHPLVVRGDRQRRGIGCSLVADLEEQVRARGAHTVFVAADNDIRVEASTAWNDLYPNVLERLRDIRGVGGHQYEFYERCGYVIVGVVPDGAGLGNIYMAKRIAPFEQG